MGDYLNRNRKQYDASAVPLAVGTVNANLAAEAGNSNPIEVGENTLVEVVVQVRGTVTGTSPTLDLKVQETDAAGGSYSDVPGGAFPQLTDADASGGEYRIQCRTSKPVIAIAATVGGTTPVFNSVEAFIAS